MIVSAAEAIAEPWLRGFLGSATCIMLDEMSKEEIKKVAENRVFANSRRIADNLLESDEPLNSPYLTAVKDDVTNMVAEKPPADTPSTPVDQPSTTVNQAPASALQPNADKEASK